MALDTITMALDTIIITMVLDTTITGLCFDSVSLVSVEEGVAT